MHDKEAVQMMERCAEMIASLHARIDALQPKADAYDAITQILGLLPRPSQGGEVDLVWTLRNRIAEIKRQPEFDLKQTAAPPNAKPGDVTYDR